MCCLFTTVDFYHFDRVAFEDAFLLDLTNFCLDFGSDVACVFLMIKGGCLGEGRA